jgi:hypothetical protein
MGIVKLFRSQGQGTGNRNLRREAPVNPDTCYLTPRAIAYANVVNNRQKYFIFKSLEAVLEIRKTFEKPMDHPG